MYVCVQLCLGCMRLLSGVPFPAETQCCCVTRFGVCRLSAAAPAAAVLRGQALASARRALPSASAMACLGGCAATTGQQQALWAQQMAAAGPVLCQRQSRWTE